MLRDLCFRAARLTGIGSNGAIASRHRASCLRTKPGSGSNTPAPMPNHSVDRRAMSKLRTRMLAVGEAERRPERLPSTARVPAAARESSAGVRSGRRLPRQAAARGHSVCAPTAAPCSVPPRPEPAHFLPHWSCQKARSALISFRNPANDPLQELQP